MDPQELMKTLSEKFGNTEDKTAQISEILENGKGLIGNGNPEDLLNTLTENLNIGTDEANNIFETAKGVIGENADGGIIDKITGLFNK